MFILYLTHVHDYINLTNNTYIFNPFLMFDYYSARKNLIFMRETQSCGQPGNISIRRFSVQKSIKIEPRGDPAVHNIYIQARSTVKSYL